MTRRERLQAAAAVAVTALVAATVVANEAVMLTKSRGYAVLEALTAWGTRLAGGASDAPGYDPSVPVFAANLVVAPLAVLLFAHALDWARRRLWVAAACGLTALPLWSACVLLRDSWPVNAVYFLLLGLQGQGIAPFGAR